MSFRPSLLLPACAALSILPLASCKVGPDYQAPAPAMPGRFASAHGEGEADGRALAAWWRELGDEALASLVEEALVKSPDAKAALARVKEARANAEAAGAALWPSVDAGAQYTRRRDSENLGNPLANQFPSRNQWGAGLTASWELDVFGGVRRGQAALADAYGAQVEEQRSVRILLAAEVARQYALLRGLSARLDAARASGAAQEAALAIAKDRFRAGLTPEAPVTGGEAQLAAQQARIAGLEQARAGAAHRLATLVGRPAGSPLPVAPPDQAGEAPRDPVRAIPVGLPSDLLRRRPDVRAAERALAAATEEVGARTAELYPRFFLTGAVGQGATTLGKLPDAGSTMWSVTPQISLHLFDRSRVKAQLRAGDARRELALANYEKAVLASLEDAENALTACDRGRAQFEAAARATKARARDLDLARENFAQGQVDQTAVLSARRGLLEAREILEEFRAQQTINLVSLYKALGGGWPAEGQSPPPAGGK